MDVVKQRFLLAALVVMMLANLAFTLVAWDAARDARGVVEGVLELEGTQSDIMHLHQEELERLRGEIASLTAGIARLESSRSNVVSAAIGSHAGGWQTATASWYGPGLYNNKTADGTLFTKDTLCVAHRTLPFGTVVEIAYRGRVVQAPVRDRGPYVAGRTFDLSAEVARRLGFSGVGTIQWRIVR